uniref:Glycosyl transferase 64 domain-containing protein n=1 Tax=Pyramimonas obovata TaxID=1411642 RepID=A0A7S0QTP1_9CHLO
MFNCEDVSFSMMVSGFTGLPPVRYQPIDRVVDKDSLDNNATSRRTLKAVGRSPASHPPPTGGRKNSAMHLPKRDHCVNTFKQEYFFYNRVYSNLAVTNWP